VTPFTSDVVVIGGGVLGLSTAYHLVREGARVTLVDRDDVGRATAAGAGILSAQTTASYTGPLYDLAIKASRHYPVLIELLAADDAGDTGFAVCPLLLVAADEAEEEPFEQARATLFERQARDGVPAPGELCDITPADARALFPPLAAARRVLLHRTSGRVDGRLLAHALRHGGERRGLMVRHGSATRLLVERGRAAGVTVDGEALRAPHVVVAAGAWSAALTEPLGVRLPVAPQRGQIAHFRMRDQDTAAWPIISGFRRHYIVSWPGGRVVAGATRETGSGFEPVLTAGGVGETLSEALRVAPGLAGAEIQEFRVGLRPLSEDGAPLLGRIPDVDGVYLATGHGGGGLQLGPFSGKLVADVILGRALDVSLEAFGVSRFRA